MAQPPFLSLFLCFWFCFSQSPPHHQALAIPAFLFLEKAKCFLFPRSFCISCDFCPLLFIGQLLFTLQIQLKCHLLQGAFHDHLISDSSSPVNFSLILMFISLMALTTTYDYICSFFLVESKSHGGRTTFVFFINVFLIP